MNSLQSELDEAYESAEFESDGQTDEDDLDDDELDDDVAEANTVGHAGQFLSSSKSGEMDAGQPRKMASETFASASSDERFATIRYLRRKGGSWYADGHGGWR